MRATTRNLALAACAVALAVVAVAALAQQAGAERAPFAVAFILPAEEPGDPLSAPVTRHLRQGLAMGIDEFGSNATMLGLDLDVVVAEAAAPHEAVAASASLVREHGVALVVGALDTAGTVALSAAAPELGVTFLNIGSSSDALRNELCNAASFHLEPSAGMYLDAVAGWYVRAGLRSWFFLVGSDAESLAQLERMRWSLRERHFGAREVGHHIVGNEIAGDDPAAAAAAVAAVTAAEPDAILLLTPAGMQLELLAALEDGGIRAEVTGYPYPDAQTRAFFAASAAAAPALGVGRRATAWEATLDAYGARELNARYAERFGEPMEPSAWKAFQAVKMVFEAAAVGGATDAASVAAYFRDPRTVFDLWKGIGVTYRPWNQQLRQPLYLVKIAPDAPTVRNRALLVGELPAIYMPRTDPVERLDQLGDLAHASECPLGAA